MIVVDSSVWISHFRNADTESVRKFRSIKDPTEVVVGDYIMLEVLRGAKDDRHAAGLERILRRFPIEQMLDDALTVRAAINYRALRDRGITVATIHLIIATFCVERGYTLLHDDHDFDAMARHIGLVIL